MKIVIDAFGGDNAPVEVIKGAADARQKFDINIILVGNEKKIRDCANENRLSLDGLKIKNASDVIEMCDDPKSIMKDKKNSSMAVGLQMLADGEGDAFVSGGSTAALLMGSTFIVKRIKGVKRPALASILPTAGNPVMLLDCGANAECRADMLSQFAHMGSIYMKKVMNMDSPRVALANIGAEETKGRPLDLETYEILKNSELNFIGNIEARQIPFGDADVVVADGFSGNLILKSCEGMGKFIANEVKNIFNQNAKSKMAALMVMNGIKAFKKKMDYTEYGGAPLLGTRLPVIKAHGSSNANAFFNAIRQAKLFVESNAIKEITEEFSNNSNAEEQQ